MKYILSGSLLLHAMLGYAQGADVPQAHGYKMVSGMAVANTVGWGYGAGVEYAFNKSKNLSAVLPLYVVFARVLSSRGQASHVNAAMYFVSPGIRYYPGKKKQDGHYAIGANLAIGNGWGGGNNGLSAVSTVKDGIPLQSRSVVAATISNTVQVHYARHWRSQIELQLGAVDDNGINIESFFAQLSFSFGYRW